MSKGKEYIVFSKQWFIDNQKTLLMVFNVSVFRNVIAKRILPFTFDLKTKVVEIMPGYIVISKNNKFTAYCFTSDFIAKAIAYHYQWLWKIIHSFDINVANRFIPSANLGFDTYYYYSEEGSGSGNDVCDGYVLRAPASNETYLNIIAGAGTNISADSSDLYVSAHYDDLGDASSGYDQNTHSYVTFDVPKLIDNATVAVAKVRIWGSAKGDYNSWNSLNTGGFSLHIVEANPLSDNNLSSGDYLRHGNTSLSGSIGYSLFALLGYNVFILNSTGISHIGSGGNTSFCFLNNFEMDEEEPNRSSDIEKINTSYFNFKGTDVGSSSQIPYLELSLSGVYIPHFIQN